MNCKMITIGCLDCRNTVRIPAHLANEKASGEIPCPVCRAEAGVLIGDARELPAYSAVRRPVLRNGVEVAANYYVFNNTTGKLVTQFAYGTPEAAEVAASNMTPAVATEPATVAVELDPCGGMHFMTVHCVECNARRMARMTPDTVEGWYRSGHFSQVEYEAYMYGWATSAARHTAGGWAQEPTDPEVVKIVAAIRRHAGVPVPLELTA